MRISRVETIPLKLPLETAFRPHQHMEHIFPVLVRMWTGSGLDSFGVCFTFARQRALVACVEDLQELVIGTDPNDSEQTWERLYKATKSMGHQGYPMYALSALDTAIWGLRSLAAGLPLAKLLGASCDRVAAYASQLLWRDRTIGELQMEAALLVGKGFRLVKMNLGGRPLAEERERVRAVREALGDGVTLLVDANWAWSTPEAVRMGRMLEEERVYWLEDPLATEDPAELAKVAAALDIPVATGENFHTTYEFRGLIERGAADILILDLQAAGGVTEWMKVAALAGAMNIPVAGHIFLDISVHLCAAAPNALFGEYMPWWDSLYVNPPVIKDGYLDVPATAGFGLVLNEEVIARYRVN
jgi:L-alanine-DL-glutamate epimerase-like enolase superfamily enzyme